MKTCDHCGERRPCVSEVKANEHGGPDLCHRCCGCDDCPECDGEVQPCQE